MKIIVQAMNKKITKGNWSTFESDLYEVNPYMITRSPCGDGAASKRFYYVAHYIGIKDMIDIHGGSVLGISCSGNINRRVNKSFKPNKLTFEGNKCVILP